MAEDDLTLELKVEQAMGALVKAEAVLGETPVRLASDDIGEQKPAPAIVISAQLLRERIRESGIWEVRLTVEVSDNAEREGSDGARLDALLAGITRPLMDEDFAETLSEARTDFHCYGILRNEQPAISREGSIVKRGRTVTLLCMGMNNEEEE